MGFFKKIFGDAADEVKKNLEEGRDEMRKSLSEMKRSTMADLGIRTSSSRGNNDDDDDDDDEPRIILGKFSNGVLDIRDDIEELDDESLEDYKNVKMIIFPRGLKKLESDVICNQDKLEELDFSFVTDLREIPDDFISGTTKIKEFIVPQGVKKLGDGFVGDCKAGTKIIIPSTVEEMGYLNGESNNDLVVYLFAPKLKIEDAEEDIKTLYVLPDYYGYYAKQLKDCDSEARLREMPEDMLNVYANLYASELTKTSAEETSKNSKEETPAPKTTKPAEGVTPLKGLVQQIKDCLQSFELSSFILYGSDYEGDRDYEEIERLADEGLLESSSEYAINYNDSYDGFSSVYTKVRKIIIQDGNVLFDLEEIYEDNNGEYESKGYYENQSIDRILNTCDSNTVEAGLERILGYLSDETLIKLNKRDEEKDTSKTESAMPISSSVTSEPNAEVSSNNSDGGMFSARLEALINSALQDGVLTEQKKAILKKRAEKEGEDWDEVEMIINARLADMKQNKGIEFSYQTSKIEIENDFPQLNDLIFDPSKEGVENERFVEIPEGYTEVVKGFRYNIEEIIFPSTMIKIGYRAFHCCRSLKRVDFSKCTKLTEIGDEAFSNHLNIDEIILPNSVKSIGERAFSQNDSLRKIVLPSSLEIIGKYAFLSCEYLNTIDLSKCSSLKTINDSAFAWCKSLEKIDIPDSVTYIGNEAFRSCDGLQHIVFPASLVEIGENVFGGGFSSSPEIIDMSKVRNLRTIPRGFANVDKQLVIPQGVTVIKDHALSTQSSRKEKYLFLPPSIERYGSNNGYWNAIYLYALEYDDLEKLFDRCNLLYVLPECLESYLGQWEALGKPVRKAEIMPMPDEFQYLYETDV